MRVFLFRFMLWCGALAPVAVAAPPVAVIEDAPWSPDDAARDGAAELGVLLQLAQLQRDHERVGLVGIGDRRGIFQEGMQRALEFAARQGVPVVRLARTPTRVAPAEPDLFIAGGDLPPAAAAALLVRCLARYGALPKLAASADESRAFREKLRLYQAEFTASQPATVAMR